MGHFKVKSKKSLDDLKVGDRIEESDYATLTPKGNFVQLEYIEEDKEEISSIIKPGIWAFKYENNKLALTKTQFILDKILEDFVHTKEITDKIDCFFKNIQVYYDYGFEVPKRGVLLYGPPGTGKTTVITKIANTYVKTGNTAILVWNTDKYEAHEVKRFIKNLKYEGVEKLILIVEDVGGVEIDEVKIRSDSALLSLLDNQEKTFKIPVLILATTNFPEVFMGNLTNRPNRFDDKIKLGFPDAEARKKLFEFFAKDKADDKCKKEIESNRSREFSPAHIREVVIRSAIYNKPILDVIKEIQKEIELYKKQFQEKSPLGL